MTRILLELGFDTKMFSVLKLLTRLADEFILSKAFRQACQAVPSSRCPY